MTILVLFSCAGLSGNYYRIVLERLCRAACEGVALRLKALTFFFAILFVTSGIGFSQAAPPAPVSTVQLVSPLRPVLTVAPGGSYQETLVLENSGTESVSVTISQVDYLPDLGGALYPEPGSSPRSNARWLTLSRAEVDVAAGEQVTVPYQIQIPDDPVLAGSYWSMFLLEPSDAVSTRTAADPGGVQTSVQTRFRYGVSVLTNVGSSGQSRLSFTEPQFVAAPDSALFNLNVENTGERLLTPKLSLTLYDAAGQALGPFEAEPGRIFPGSAVRAPFALGSLSPGNYQALIVADAGAEHVYGIRYMLNVTAP